MRVTMMSTLHFFVLMGCTLQFLGVAATDETLPFEVDVDSGTDFGNVGFDKKAGGSTGNRLTAQASKQGENFVASPKPANTQGFSFDAEPETIARPSKPTKTTPVSSATNGATTAGAENKHSAGHWFWPNFLFSGPPHPFGLDFHPFSKMNPFSSEFHKPSPYNSNFPVEKSNPTAYDFPVGTPFGPNFPFNSYSFQMPPIPSPPAMHSLGDMKLVEDRILDDEHSEGRFRTYKSKDGNALIQIMHRQGRLTTKKNPAPAEKSRSQVSGGRRRPRRHPHFLRRGF